MTTMIRAKYLSQRAAAICACRTLLEAGRYSRASPGRAAISKWSRLLVGGNWANLSATQSFAGCSTPPADSRSNFSRPPAAFHVGPRAAAPWFSAFCKTWLSLDSSRGWLLIVLDKITLVPVLIPPSASSRLAAIFRALLRNHSKQSFRSFSRVELPLEPKEQV